MYGSTHPKKICVLIHIVGLLSPSIFSTNIYTQIELLVNVSSEIQEKIVLDELGQIELWDHFVYPAFQESPETAASQVLQRARSHFQGED